ncbi:NAD(P)-dependent oxidoreductase [Pararhizobium mangrovi]|uniref:NAD(P)-dependent oxidoreductase n=2 Tax=Pararhizobium mangrovi TaxID=2590452 RepID=A0A506U3C1_9HYPH|nr:NAD(P)-dependent oxidoreductase [Pararhizobium mangrovi]
MTERIGFIGLGSLGLPMARNLMAAGYPLTVYNRTASKAAPLTAKGAMQAERPVDAVTPGGIVVSVLWDADAVDNVVDQNGFLDRLGPGGVHIAMCTGSPEAAKTLAARHAEKGCTYVEAPIFGRPEAAEAKALWIPFAGPAEAKERARPILTALGAQGVFDFGEEIGTATIVKLVGNFLIVSASNSLREAVTMARNSGVDAPAVIDMLTQTLFPAPIYQSYGKRLAEGGAAFGQSDIPAKDVGLFKDAAGKAKTQTPIAEMLLDLL